jgi:hypothetical protein
VVVRRIGAYTLDYAIGSGGISPKLILKNINASTSTSPGLKKWNLKNLGSKFFKPKKHSSKLGCPVLLLMKAN